MQRIGKLLLAVSVLLLATTGIAASETASSTIDILNGFTNIVPHFKQTGPSSSASVRVIPDEGDQGDTHTILVSALQDGETITVRIVQDSSGTEVYSSSQTADNSGRIQLEIFTTPDDEPGAYTVEVINSAGTVIGTANLTIRAPAGSDAELRVTPASAIAGTSYTLSISGVRPFSDLEILVLNEAQERVFTTQIRSTVDGEATVEYESSPRDGGTYTVIVREDETELASATIEIEGPVFLAETTLLPTEVNPGDDVIVSITGLESNQDITVDVTSGAETITTQDKTADINGNVIFTLSTADASPGTYTVSVQSAGDMLSEATYTVLGATLRLTVTPDSGPTDRPFAVNVVGLEQGETARIELVEDGAVVLTREVTGDVNGIAVALLNEDSTLSPGNYDVRVIQNGVSVAQTGLTVETAIADTDDGELIATPTPQPPPTGEPALTIDPASGPIPTNYAITASGLAPGSEVTINIVFQGDVVFTIDGIADSSGIFESGVVSETGDTPGTYTLELAQNGEVLTTTSFAITEAATTPPPQPGAVTVVVEPETVGVGEEFEIRIEGLTPDAPFELNITFQGTSIYSTTRSADGEGAAVINLVSDSTDEPGAYDVVVRQNGADVASAQFLIGAAETGTPPASDVSITVDPASGVLGTDHAITVTGLNPNETVTLDIRFGGDSVFSTRRTADSSGAFEIDITSEEGDPAGLYRVVVLRGETEVAAADLTVTAAEPGAQPTPTAPLPSEPTVSIEPASGPTGTSHTIRVRGLAANAAVTLEVRYGGEIVFTTQRTADVSGVVIVNLQSDEGDSPGTYTVAVLQDSTEVASSEFVIEGPAAPPPAATPAATPTPGPDITEGDGPRVSVDPTSGPIGTAHTITISGLEPNERVDLEVSYQGDPVFTSSRQADVNGAIIFTLTSEEGDAEGQYLISVLRDGAAIAQGTFTIGAETAAAPTGEGQSQVYEERLTFEAPERRFRFTGEAGDTVIIRLTSDDFDTYVLLEDDRGSILGEDDDSGGDLNSQIGPYTLPYSGSYTVVASSYSFINENEPANGGFSLTIEFEDIETVTLALGSGNQAVSERLTTSRPSIRFTFEGVEGETVLISLDSSDFDTHLILEDNRGAELTSNDDANDTTNAQIGPYTLPFSGTYTIVASSYSYTNFGDIVPGEFDLRVERVVVSEAAYGETQTLEMTEETSAQMLSFEAQTGEVISVEVDSGGSVDTRLSLIDPGGFSVLSDDDSGSGYDPEIPRFVIPEGGTYTLSISTFSPGDTGSVQVTINRVDIRTLDTETRIVRLNSKQASDILTLDGHAGEALRLDISLIAGNVGNLNITVQQNEETLMFYQTFGMPEAINLGFEVTRDAPVRITVEDFNTTGATLEFAITRDGQ